MQNSIQQTVNAAQKATQTLAATIHAAADQIAALDTSEVQEALERLARATLDARARLDALRSHAEGILGLAFDSFVRFEDEVTEPVSAPAMPAPEPVPAPEPEVIAFTPEPATTVPEPEPEPTPEPVQAPVASAPGCRVCGGEDGPVCRLCTAEIDSGLTDAPESEPVAASGPEPSTNGRPARKGGKKRR